MAILLEVINALKSIRIPRFHNSERAFQAEFYRVLCNQLEGKHIFPDHTILEAEVQKRKLEHYGVTQRPDILIHIPIETGIAKNANENNFVNIAFKLAGNEGSSLQDFEKMEQMFRFLNYEMGIFINIGKYPEIFLNMYQGNYRDRIHEFSIGLNRESINIRHAYFENDEIIFSDV